MTYEDLKTAFDGSKVVLNDDLIASFSRYASLLKEWNEKMNLTAITDEPAVIEKHFYDSLLIAKNMDFAGKSVADIGSGAGFPGMAIALAFPSSKVTLIDATRKKFLFLDAVKKELGIKNVNFYVGRVEEMKSSRNHFDIVTARGFAAMNIFLEVAAPLAKKGGTLIAMKGVRGEEELVKSKFAIHRLGLKKELTQKDVLPDGEIRLNYFFTKLDPTPSSYPRPWGEIVRKPL